MEIIKESNQLLKNQNKSFIVSSLFHSNLYYLKTQITTYICKKLYHSPVMATEFIGQQIQPPFGELYLMLFVVILPDEKLRSSTV